MTRQNCALGAKLGWQLAINSANKSEKTGLVAVIAEATSSSFSHRVNDKIASMGPHWLMHWSGWLLACDEYFAIHSVWSL
ncbi:hypothetical protein OAF56_02830 [Pirellulaceae bacterium]|nr:hypothetical protein [Pirellulaceae bacterium]